MDEERPILSEGGITITRTRFVVGNRTYAVGAITSVVAGNNGRDVRLALWIFVFGAIVMFVLAGSASPFAGPVTLVVMGAGIVYMMFFAPQRYVVRLRTSGGEISAYQSPNLAFVKRITDALSQAIISRADDRTPELSRPSHGPLDQIAQLGELRKQGLITDEEFSAKKRQLLGVGGVNKETE